MKFWFHRELIAKNIKSIDGLDSFKYFIGKKVFSKSGEFIGKIVDVGVSNDSLVGVFVNGKKRLFIEKSFFESGIQEVLMLNIEPISMLLGKLVFDANGRKLGHVIGLDRKGFANQYQSLIVRKSIFRKAFSIPKSDISVSMKNIILKSVYE